MDSKKYIGMECSQGSDLDRGSELFWQAGDGMRD
jgi:hypothetical protein